MAPMADTAPKRLPRMELGELTPHNVKQLRLLNSVVFPVSYNDKFYKDVLNVGEYAKLAYFEDIVVGAVCCRVDTEEGSGVRKLYIMTLGCLQAYRGLGLGKMMLEHVLAEAAKDSTLQEIYLHVQISNEEAIGFYKHFGFDVIETRKDYYKRIKPADAYVVSKRLGEAATTEK
eukprot:m.483237 g.483237  ORF g.483237 m.483237 type:complete len:174 (-) comp22838_c0_seq1:43-564(-)